MLVILTGWATAAAQTKEQCREAEAKRGRKDAEMAKIAKDTSAALMAKRVLKAQERAKKEAARLGSEPPSPLTPGAGAHHGSGGASPDQKLRRTDGKGGKFQTQSLHDKQLDREKEVQRIMDLLRALENARLPTGQGYMQLQDAVRPRSYTHEVLKNAGLKYRRGRPVFENDVGAKRSASALACVDVPDASGRYREQGSNMAVVDRFSRSFTPSANERQGASAHRSTSPRHHGILRSKSRRATLAPLAGVKQPPLLSEDILSFSLPILCKSKASETSELAEATREPDEQQKHQDQIAADLEDDDAMVERGPDNVAKQRVKDSKAQLAKRIAFRVDEDAIVLNKQASHSAVIKKIVLHDGEARDAMRRVENILGDLFGIDVRQYAIPIRVTDDHTEIKALVAAQKTRLNAGILDVQPRYVCVRSEISIPKGMGRHLHTMAYNNKKQGGSVQDAGFSDKLASSRELEQNLEVKLAEIKHETPGLKWEDIGEKRPATGTEMSCSQLESALHDRTVFTKGELQKFGATRVSFESYIKVGETYFKPSGGERAAMTRQGEAELDSIRNSIGKFRKEEQLLRAKQRREGGEQRGAAAGAKLPPMDYQRVKIEASSARAHARVHRDVKEIVVVRGMSLYQLSAEIAKAVGSAFLFLEHYDGLDASTEGAFCELCSYLWAKEEKSQVQATAEKHQYIIAERECELAYTNEELKVLEVEVKEAHKEREEADAAELHAKKALASAKDAVKYGWPGAERKMAAAKQAEIDAARELEEAIEAESKTIGKQYPEGVEKQRHVSAELGLFLDK